ncbi:hypothetical protein [Erythrobacter sp. HL-111]|uniref:hypothetical protein n=1 Tax=Erythrobacter sp. HL-111 TaxID=1798193 RepID=UPI00156043D0|nr:hypothetical protein [Erythrobacter sp. HL-111]
MLGLLLPRRHAARGGLLLLLPRRLLLRLPLGLGLLLLLLPLPFAGALPRTALPVRTAFTEGHRIAALPWAAIGLASSARLQLSSSAEAFRVPFVPRPRRRWDGDTWQVRPRRRADDPADLAVGTAARLGAERAVVEQVDMRLGPLSGALK